jgi:GTP cyclohydrolase I
MLDVQGSTITRSHAIQNVGVSGLDYPLTVDLGGDAFRAAAKWTLGVSLRADQRGAHMSRFVESVDALGGVDDNPVSISGMVEFAGRIRQTLEASRATCEVQFTWFRRVHAPVSRKSALNPHQVTWQVESSRDVEGAGAGNDRAVVTVQVPVKSLCPCSKAISDRGAHNQRSKITVSVRGSNQSVTRLPSVERIVAMIESHASSPVYPLLKRADEKYVTEHAYDNPGFVEDLVRAVAGSLEDLAEDFPGVEAFRVHVRNEESIHAHDCFAEITSKNW